MTAHTNTLHAIEAIEWLATELMPKAPTTAALLQAAAAEFAATAAALRVTGTMLEQAEAELDTYKQAAVFGAGALVHRRSSEGGVN